VIYCIVPSELAAKAHERLREHFRGDSLVEVVVEQRTGERRRRPERRAPRGDATVGEGSATERRRIRNAPGRRVAERRAASVPAPQVDPLPRSLRRYAERLVFVERIAPPSADAEDLDTARLVTRIQGGDESLFGDLYLRYFDRVYTQLKMILRDPHEAEDATQEVFIRVMKGLPQYERREAPFRGWLSRVVRNYSLTLLGRQAPDVRDPTALQLDVERSAARSGELNALTWLSDPELMLFVERLPLAQQQVIVLRYMLDLPTAEIAAILNTTSEAVRQMHHRALKFLEARLTSIGRATPTRHRQPLRRTLRQARVVRARRFALTHTN
jgi:RNA polymerase sigma-70 factor (ECF subfamily)